MGWSRNTLVVCVRLSRRFPQIVRAQNNNACIGLYTQRGRESTERKGTRSIVEEERAFEGSLTTSTPQDLNTFHHPREFALDAPE
jgi:hypothetical protein